MMHPRRGMVEGRATRTDNVCKAKGWEKTCVSSGQGTRSNHTVHGPGQRNDASTALRAQATATAAYSTRRVPAKFEVRAQGTVGCRDARPLTSTEACAMREHRWRLGSKVTFVPSFSYAERFRSSFRTRNSGMRARLLVPRAVIVRVSDKISFVPSLSSTSYLRVNTNVNTQGHVHPDRTFLPIAALSCTYRRGSVSISPSSSSASVRFGGATEEAAAPPRWTFCHVRTTPAVDSPVRQPQDVPGRSGANMAHSTTSARPLNGMRGGFAGKRVAGTVGRRATAVGPCRQVTMMASKVSGYIKLALEAGKANPSPPVGPALGSKGVNIMAFCKEYNARTADQAGKVIPVEITVFEDKSFTFVLKTPPASFLLKEAAGIGKGSGNPSKEKVGKVTIAQLKEIAETKMPDLNANNLEAAVKIIEGTAKNMGLQVVEA